MKWDEYELWLRHALHRNQGLVFFLAFLFVMLLTAYGL